MLAAAGMSHDDAAMVSEHVVGNSLMGVDSHGAVRFSQYMSLIESGAIDPLGTPLVVAVSYTHLTLPTTPYV